MSGYHRLCVRVLGAVLAGCLIAPVGSALAQEEPAATVDMQGISFLPLEVHVGPGALVLWTNSSPLGHTVTADDGAFDSGMLDPGATFSMVFDSPGVYQFYCAPHGAAGLKGMSGVIVVDDPGAVEAAAAEPPATPPQGPAEDEYVPDD
jgi:plastocyanin